MESRLVSCSCGANLKVPVTLSAAKAVKCPKCGSVVDLGAVATSAAPATALKPAASPAPAAPRSKPTVAHVFDEEEDLRAPTTKACPFCGETIQATAVKCRHCNEFLDSAKSPTRAKSKALASAGDEPNPAEYFVAIFIAPIGLIIGLVWMLKKQAKAVRMLQASGLSLVIVTVAGLIAKMYIFSGPVTPEPVAAAPVMPFRLSGRELDELEQGRPPQPPEDHNGQPEGMGTERVNLDGQPPQIQRAMRANVKLEISNGMGSGVVLQRNDKMVVILTNRHVIDRMFSVKKATPDLKEVPRVRVTYYNEQSNPGTVTWIAPDEIDLALIEAAAPQEIEPVSWASDPKILVGQEVFAVGNPINLGWSFSKGVVGALRLEKRGRLDVGVVQTDTKVTFGNSGGGLYRSADGELIGINTRIADPRLGAGLAFALRPQVLFDLKPKGLNLPPKVQEPAKTDVKKAVDEKKPAEAQKPAGDKKPADD
jgi:S1-C subfamily serine protease/predicted RNA-binding Zn-ribbon protein involved in translation (DUF1610 family)